MADERIYCRKRYQRSGPYYVGSGARYLSEECSMSDLGATAIDRDSTPFANGETPPTAPTTRSSPDTNKIIAALTKTYAAFGIGLYAVPNEGLKADGRLVVTNAEELAESWRYLLDNDPKVRRTLKKLIETGGWTSVIMVHGGLLLTAVKENHPNVVGSFTRRRQRQTTFSAE